MDAVAALRTRKVFVDATPWGVGNIGYAAFPLSHKGKIKMGKAWNWCVHRVEDAHREYRVLVAFDPTKNQFWAWLAASVGNDQAVLARVEIHHTHDGWHCHWKTGKLVDVPRGAVKASGAKEKRRDCSDHPVPTSKSSALNLAYRLFNIGPKLGELGI